MAWHSYEFYEKRQNAWLTVKNYKEAYERKVRRATLIRSIISLLIISQLIIVIWLVLKYIYIYDIHKINQEMIMTLFGYVKVEYWQVFHHIWDFIRNNLIH